MPLGRPFKAKQSRANGIGHIKQPYFFEAGRNLSPLAEVVKDRPHAVPQVDQIRMLHAMLVIVNHKPVGRISASQMLFNYALQPGVRFVSMPRIVNVLQHHAGSYFANRKG